MAAKPTAPKIVLLSNVITPKEDGEYTYAQKSLMIPHEALRREMAFGTNALDHLDAAKHPWKAHCFHNWLSTFLAPSIHGHHDLEEHRFFDFYKKLGANVPEKQSSDHKTLIEMLNNVIENSSKMLNLVTLGGDNQEPLRAAIEELKTSYATMVQHMISHLDEEDSYWPTEVAKFGEAQFKKCEAELVEYGRVHEGKNFENFACSVIYATGGTISNVPHRDGDTCWAGEKTRADFLLAFPYPVRALLLPGWNKRYQRYKTMILSVCGEVDVLHIQDQQPGCAPGCVIA